MAGPSKSASESGGTLEELPLNTPFRIGSDGSEGNVNRVALIVWDQLLTTNNVMAIIGHNSFTRGLQRLFSIQQQEEIMKLIRSNLITRRIAFICSGETSIPRLRLSLQEMFTQIVTRHTRGQVGLEKEYVNNRITELNSLSLQVTQKLAEKDEATHELASSITAAHRGIDILHRQITHALDGADIDELQVSTKEHTMAVLGEVLNNIVKQNAVTLPTIIPEAREENEDQEIYHSDYNQIPVDMKILYLEAARLCSRAQQAKHKESTVLEEYTLTSTRLELAVQQGLKLHEAHSKLKELVEFEELIRVIMLEGTFWKHYKVKPPGNEDKVILDEVTGQQSIKELEQIAETMSDVRQWKNHETIGKMAKTAKEYVMIIKGNLASYTNAAQVTEALIFAESAITSCEDVITKNARKTSSNDPSLFAAEMFSVTTPLTATPASAHSMLKTRTPISTHVG